MATHEETQRWRAFLGLDTSTGPLPTDIEHVQHAFSDLYGGRRSDLGPEAYRSHWPLNVDAEAPPEANPSSDPVASPETDTLARETALLQLTSHSTSPFKFAPQNQHAEMTPVPTELPATVKAALSAPPLPFGEFQAVIQADRAQRDREMQTKDGRARWEAIEAGRNPSMTWKVSRERAARHRTDQLLNWRLVQAAMKQRAEKIAKGSETPADKTKDSKGKKKGKR